MQWYKPKIFSVLVILQTIYCESIIKFVIFFSLGSFHSSLRDLFNFVLSLAHTFVIQLNERKPLITMVCDFTPQSWDFALENCTDRKCSHPKNGRKSQHFLVSFVNTSLIRRTDAKIEKWLCLSLSQLYKYFAGHWHEDSEVSSSVFFSFFYFCWRLCLHINIMRSKWIHTDWKFVWFPWVTTLKIMMMHCNAVALSWCITAQANPIAQARRTSRTDSVWLFFFLFFPSFRIVPNDPYRKLCASLTTYRICAMTQKWWQRRINKIQVYLIATFQFRFVYYFSSDHGKLH